MPLRLFGVRQRSVVLMTAICVAYALFTLVPLAWIAINATKTQANIYHSFGFWFARPFVLFHNFTLLIYHLPFGGTYLRWLGNSVLYSTVGGLGAASLSGLAGYGFAHYRFRFSRAMFAALIAVLLVPATALTLPLYLVYAKVGLLNSILGMVMPSVVTPVGIYIMRIYAQYAVPAELIDAARTDGAGEVWIFLRIAVPLMVPGLVTVLLLSVVAVWNSYFLPLVLFSRASLYPLTVGLGLVSAQANGVTAGVPVTPLLVVGALVSILPLVLLFVVLQKYWRGGLLFGSTVG